jgi:hypothetical protein
MKADIDDQTGQPRRYQHGKNETVLKSTKMMTAGATSPTELTTNAKSIAPRCFVKQNQQKT